MKYKKLPFYHWIIKKKFVSITAFELYVLFEAKIAFSTYLTQKKSKPMCLKYLLSMAKSPPAIVGERIGLENRPGVSKGNKNFIKSLKRNVFYST